MKTKFNCHTYSILYAFLCVPGFALPVKGSRISELDNLILRKRSSVIYAKDLALYSARIILQSPVIEEAEEILKNLEEDEMWSGRYYMKLLHLLARTGDPQELTGESARLDHLIDYPGKHSEQKVSEARMKKDILEAFYEAGEEVARLNIAGLVQVAPSVEEVEENLQMDQNVPGYKYSRGAQGREGKRGGGLFREEERRRVDM